MKRNSAYFFSSPPGLGGGKALGSFDLGFPASVSPSVETSIACGSFTRARSTLFVGSDSLGYAKADSPAGGTPFLCFVDVVKTGWARVQYWEEEEGEECM